MIRYRSLRGRRETAIFRVRVGPSISQMARLANAVCSWPNAKLRTTESIHCPLRIPAAKIRSKLNCWSRPNRVSIFELCSNQGTKFFLIEIKNFCRQSIKPGEKGDGKERQPSEAERRQSLFPGKKTEEWVEPLPDEETSFQQQVHKFAQLTCVYSRPNAKIRWFKDKKEIFSGGLKYKIIIEKAKISLMINNPDVDDCGVYTCEANGVRTNCNLIVQG